MEKLLEQSRINDRKLQQTMLKLTSSDVNNLALPCFIPGHKKEYHTLLNVTGLTDKDVKSFARRAYKGTPVQNFNIAKEPGTNLLLFIMWYALKKRNTVLYHTTMIYHLIRQYGHSMKKSFPKGICSPEIFEYAMDSLTKTHLFYREKTIANSIMYLAKEIEKKYTNDIKTFNIDGIIQFIYVSRHRISQSAKSFAEHYYRAWNSGKAMNIQSDVNDDESINMHQQQQKEKGKQLIDSTVKKLTVYKTIDPKAVRDAITITKIKPIIADLIVRELKDIKYADELRLILQLFVKDVTDRSMFCGKGYYLYVKKLMAVKRTRSKIYFKQQINILITRVMKNIGYTETFNAYTSQTQYMINSFLAFYLTMCMRNSIC